MIEVIMSKEGSVAPKERINIKYIPATGDTQSEIELPFKILVVGDFKGHAEDTSIEERKAISINKDNFQSVMRENNLSINTSVDNKLSADKGDDLSIKLQFKSLEDFSPDSVVSQVPEVNKLIELREALVALKGPLGNIPAFRERMQELLGSEEDRNRLLSELELVDSSNKDV